MRDFVALIEGRAVVRLAATGLALLWLSGCSSDTTRFSDSFSNPFSNPFASNDGSASATAAPTPKVSSAPLAQNAQPAPSQKLAVDAHPSPVASAEPQAPAPETTGAIRSDAQPVGGGSAGWTAVGGSPIVLVQGDTLASVSKRYGVPTAALLSANGLSGANQIHGGMRIVIPVYHADAKTAAETKAAESKVADLAKDRKASEKLAKADDAVDRKKPKPTDKAKEKELAKADTVEPAAKSKKTVKDQVADGGQPAKPAKADSAAAKPATGTTTVAKSDLPPPCRRAGQEGRRRHDRDRQPPRQRRGRAGHQRRGRRVGFDAGIPLAGARPHHPGLRGGRQ